MKRLIQKAKEESGANKIKNFLDQIAAYHYEDQMPLVPEILNMTDNAYTYNGPAYRVIRLPSNENINSMNDEDLNSWIIQNIKIDNNYASWSKTETGVMSFIDNNWELGRKEFITVIISFNVSNALDLFKLAEDYYNERFYIGEYIRNDSDIFKTTQEILAPMTSDYQVYKILSKN